VTFQVPTVLPERLSPSTVAAAALAGAAVFSARLALANGLLVVALGAGWVAWRRGELAGHPLARPLLAPLAAFAALSVLAALASLDPLVSVGNLPRLLVFAVVPLAAAWLDESWWPRLVTGLALTGGVLSVWGIVQYHLGADSLEHRIRGPLSHYMTYSGWLLLVVLVLLTDALLSGRRLWQVVPAALGIVALVLSFTRNAWVGLVAGLLLLAVLWHRRLLLVYPLAFLLLWAVLPHAIVARAVSTVDLRQPANYDRLCMAISGVQMVRDHPWSGVGLGMVSSMYSLYRRDDAPRWRVPHLHNNLLQIAAERGLPAAAAYLWLLGAFARQAWRGVGQPDRRRRVMAAASLVAVTGITVAGLFEYNFWDAEIQYLTLVLMGVGARTGEVAPR